MAKLIGGMALHELRICRLATAKDVCIKIFMSFAKGTFVS